MKRKYGIVALILALIMSLTACGSNKPDDKTTVTAITKQIKRLSAIAIFMQTGYIK